MRYTYLGLSLVALSAILYLEAFLFENLIPAFCGLGIIAYMIYDRLSFSEQLENQRLEIKREVMEKMLFADKPFTVLTRVRNLGDPIRITFEEVVPEGLELRSGTNSISTDLNSGEVAKIKYTAQAKKRGYYTIDRIKIESKDRAGFFESDSMMTHATHMRVHSSREELRKAHTVAKREHMEMLGKSPERWSRTREFEFEGIREFVPGDRFRDIDWKSFSRVQKLMTKVYERETMVPTTILLDCGRSMRIAIGEGSKLDHGIRLSIQLTKVLLSGYHPTGVVAFDDIGTVARVKPDVVRGQYDKVLRALLHVPQEIRTDTVAQPRPATEAVVLQDAAGGKFVSVVSSFIGGHKRGAAKGKVGAEGIVREAIAKGGKGQMFMFISDLESNQDAIVKAASLARAHGHRVILASPDSTLYGICRESLTVERIEELYDPHLSKLKTLARLRRLGVIVLELGPKDEAATIARQIRRMTI